MEQVSFPEICQLLLNKQKNDNIDLPLQFPLNCHPPFSHNPRELVSVSRPPKFHNAYRGITQRNLIKIQTAYVILIYMFGKMQISMGQKVTVCVFPVPSMLWHCPGAHRPVVLSEV